MIIKGIEVKDIISKSNIPGGDFTINPYIGCPHACKYCYACFMKKFTNHPEPWGEFCDIKIQTKPLNTKRLIGKNVFMSSATDCYNPLEKKYEVTKRILEHLIDVDCNLTITTKSDLILRDIDILHQMKNLTVSFSINTLDEKFKNDMDRASSVQNRLEALRVLHENKIHTALFMSPMVPFITDFKEIIGASRDFIDEYWFENLNLRHPYKNVIMKYIQDNYPQYFQDYVDIYVRHNKKYWLDLKAEIKKFCEKENVIGHNYFHCDY
jgi:DNA repair photolyase